MREPSTLLVSIVLILLPAIPGFLFNFYAFVGASIVGLAIVMYYFSANLPWKGVRQAIVSLYFTGVFSLGLALGVFFAMPIKPKEFALVSLIESIPFFISFAYVAKAVLVKAINKDILKVGNGYFAMLLIIILGGLAGRFLHNFYELIILYSGFIALGIIAYLYFKE
ncbi:hypothetical protein [Acidianus sp. HS-5]|uniref:hypothetical protein n=1 Tax=Acidianus sp. HS-5 TaxID=2886040 RepID=UPI001F2B1361|nr:hypothetical protein [Acidianus sp. HS-5]BDC18070.1 hypothetical protein HS5_09600 [Acidianus sp. HS-5]